jgi:hypothetical protein
MTDPREPAVGLERVRGPGLRVRCAVLGASAAVTVLVGAAWALGETTAWSHGEVWHRFWSWSGGLVPPTWTCLSLALGLPAGLALGWLVGRRGGSRRYAGITGVWMVAISMALGTAPGLVTVLAPSPDAYFGGDAWAPISLLVYMSVIYVNLGLVVGLAQAAGFWLGFRTHAHFRQRAAGAAHARWWVE